MLKVIFFLLFNVTFIQALPFDQNSKYSPLLKDNLIISNNFTDEYSSYSTRTSALNGKIELAGLLLLNQSAGFILELEKQISNSHFMWLFQIGGGAFRTHLNEVPLNKNIFPYASAHVGLRYKSTPGLTFSLLTGIRSIELGLWNMASIGWDVMNKLHIEFGLTSILIFPVALTLSVGTPLVEW